VVESVTNGLLQLVFWIASALVVYPYVIYPLLLMALGRKNGVTATNSQAPQHSITLLISAFNEADVIDEKLRNSLSLNYPVELLRVVVVSDASDDGTDEIVNSWSQKDARIRLFRQEQREGKTAGINAAIDTIDTDLIVFSDANAIYETDALRHMEARFSDQEVGYVVGSALYVETDADAVKDSEGLYWQYELKIKQLEANFESVVGGDGAIYAIRRPLFWPLASNEINDFANPLQIVANGHRGVFSAAARCYEYAADAFEQEFSRKRRIVNRSWRAVTAHWAEFNWREHHRFLFCLVSHKVIRWWCLPLILLAQTAALLLLITSGSWVYGLAFVVISVSFVLAYIGRVLDRGGIAMPRIVYLLYYFYFVNLARLKISNVFLSFRNFAAIMALGPPILSTMQL